MNFKQYFRYQMNFSGKWAKASAALMGLSFFLRIVYYFGFKNLMDISFGEILVFMILPMLLCGAYLALMCYLRYNATGVFGMIAAGLCVLLLIWSCCTGNILRILFGIIFYAAAGFVIFVTSGGFLPDLLLSKVLFALPLILRVLIFGISDLTGGFTAALQLSATFLLASLFCLPGCFVPVRHKSE